MDSIVHGVAKSQTQLSKFHFISLHLTWNSDLQDSGRHYVKLTCLQMRGLSQTLWDSWELQQLETLRSCLQPDIWKGAPEDPGEQQLHAATSRHHTALHRALCLQLFGCDSTILEVAQSSHQRVSPLFYSAPIFKSQTIQEKDFYALNSATYKL